MPLERVGQLLREGAYLQVCQEAEQLLQDGGLTPHAESGLLRAACRACGSLQDYYAAVKYGERAIEIARRIGNIDIQGRAHFDVGVSYVYIGDTHAAERNLAAFLALAPSMKGVEKWDGKAYYNLSFVFRQRKDWRKAVEALERAVILYEQHGEDALRAQAHLDIAWCYLMNGKPAEAKPFVDAVGEFVACHETHDLVNDFLCLKALYCRCAGDISTSARLCAEIFIPGRKGVTSRHLGEVAWIMGENALDVGHLNECEVFASMALDYAIRDNFPTLMNLGSDLRRRLSARFPAGS